MSPSPSPTLKGSPHQRWPGIIFVLLLLVLPATPACAGAPSGEPEPAAEQEPQADGKEGGAMSKENTPEEAAPELEPPLDELAAAAKSALAEKLGIDENEITLTLAEKVLWRDGSLGCPEPEMMYMQMLVDGARLVLEADGEAYHYHSNLAGPPRYCENPDPNGAMPPEEGGDAPM